MVAISNQSVLTHAGIDLSFRDCCDFMGGPPTKELRCEGSKTWSFSQFAVPIHNSGDGLAKNGVYRNYSYDIRLH